MALQFDGTRPDLEGTMLVIGAGKMGAALLDGFLSHGVKPSQIAVQDPNPDDAVKQRLAQHGIACSGNAASELTTPPQVLLLAVKPQILTDIMPTLKGALTSSTLVLSVVAGKPVRVLEGGFGSAQPIIRAMPNTPAAIGAGMTVCFANSSTTKAHTTLANALFACVGDVAWIGHESLMDAVTAVSGSGPAYVFLLAEALAEAGVAAGLEPDLSERLARATLSGAGQLLARSDHSAATLRGAVTSPGGTTAAALDVLMDNDALKGLLRTAVAAAKKRGQELAG